MNSPPSLIEAQSHMIAGEYDKALEYLKNEPLADKRADIAQEISFSRAYCMAQLTLSGEVDLKDAAVQMMDFLKIIPTAFTTTKPAKRWATFASRRGPSPRRKRTTPS